MTQAMTEREKRPLKIIEAPRVGHALNAPPALIASTLHRVRERLVSQRTGIINQIRAFLFERGIAVRQGLRFLRAELPRILATPPDVLSLITSSAVARSSEQKIRYENEIVYFDTFSTADISCRRALRGCETASPVL
jgi:transposase